MKKLFSLLLLSSALMADTAFWDIQKVKWNDTLNIRQNADHTSKKIGSIPFNGKCVINYGCGQNISYDILINMDEEGVKAFLAQAKDDWCYIKHNEKTGWVSKYYLKESSSECK